MKQGAKRSNDFGLDSHRSYIDHISIGLREIEDRPISTLPLPAIGAMKAFVVHELAHPSKIKLTEDWPTPTLGENQIMVDVYSAGINFFDVSEVNIPFGTANPSPTT